MRTIAVGVSGKLLETEAGNIVRLTGDALQTGIKVEGTGPESQPRSWMPAACGLPPPPPPPPVQAFRPRVLDSGAQLGAVAGGRPPS